MKIYFIKGIFNEILTSINPKNLIFSSLMGLSFSLFFNLNLFNILFIVFLLILLSSKFVRICFMTMRRDIRFQILKQLKAY